MTFIVLFLAEIVVLYFFSKKFTRKFSNLFYRLTKSKKWTVWITSILFLPGTLLHELSHFLVALFLLIPVGEISFTPEFNEDEVQLGSVEIGKTDFIRRFFVGASPLIFGLGTLFGSLYWLVNLDTISILPIVITSYISFAVGNTLFSSRKDLEGAWKLLIVLVGLFAALYLLGVRFQISSQSFLSNEFIRLVKIGNIFLLVPISIDLLLIFLISSI
jgi:hypothetical protein